MSNPKIALYKLSVVKEKEEFVYKKRTQKDNSMSLNWKLSEE